MSLGMTFSPTVPGGGAASYKLRPVFTYNYCEEMVIGKFYSRFSGDFFCGFGGGVEGRGLCGRIFPWRNMSWGNRNSMKMRRIF